MTKPLTKIQYEALRSVLENGYGTKDGFAIEQATDQPEARRSLKAMARSGMLVPQREGNRTFYTLGPKGENWPVYVLTDDTIRLLREYEQREQERAAKEFARYGQDIGRDEWDF